MQKKAEMGVGTLIVFIAMLLVAAVAAGVLIQTASALQEKSLSTGQQARAQISTNARVIEVSGSDGRQGNLTDFQQILKLAPGSEPIKLDQIIFTFNTKDSTSTLKYRGTDCECEKNNSNGYNTWNEEELGEMRIYRHQMVSQDHYGQVAVAPVDIAVDLDGDKVTDTVLVCSTGQSYCPQMDGEYLQFNISSFGFVYVRLFNDTGYVNISVVGIPIDMEKVPIGGYGYVSIKGTNSQAWRIRYLVHNMTVEIDPMNRLEEDLDDDGLEDMVAFNNTHAVFWISSQVNSTNESSISVSLGGLLNVTGTNFNASGLPISNGTETFGYFSIEGTNVDKGYFPEGGIATVTPYKLGEGYFIVTYQQEGTNHIAGNLQRGDIIKMCYEAPGEILEDELIRLNFIPKIGTATLTQFVTPDVISTERVYLYP